MIILIAKSRFLLFLKFFLALSVLLSCQERGEVSGSLAIINGTVIDGTGEQPYKGDIIIDHGQIIWIGDRSQVKIVVDTTIDAEGMVITPGFIDIHAHGDPLKTPEFSNFLAMGVTTIALGMDGSSKTQTEMADWMMAVDKQPPGVNIIPFIGHGTLRNESGIGLSANPGTADMNKLTTLLDSALNQGIWGLSMGLEYFPGYYARSDELKALAAVVGKYDRLITSHIRNEDDSLVEKSLNEMIDLAEFCRVNISHIKVVYGHGRARGLEILDVMTRREMPHPVTADLYPYTASYTGIGIVFPEWAKKAGKYGEVKKRRGDELAQFLKRRVNQRNGPAATLFGNGPYKGKTLAEVAEEYDLPFEIILRDIIGPYGSSAAFFVMDQELQQTLARHSHVMFGSDGSPTMYHPRGYGSFARVIEKFVVQDSVLLLPEAIRKMSLLPASTLGLHDRGRIGIDMVADLLVFDPAKIRALSDFDSPHILARGMTSVIMDGEIAYTDQMVVKSLGKILLAK